MLVFENSLNRNLNYPDLRCKTSRAYVIRKCYLVSYLTSTWESQDVIYKNFCWIGWWASFEYYTIKNTSNRKIIIINISYHSLMNFFLKLNWEIFVDKLSMQLSELIRRWMWYASYFLKIQIAIHLIQIRIEFLAMETNYLLIWFPDFRSSPRC